MQPRERGIPPRAVSCDALEPLRRLGIQPGKDERGVLNLRMITLLSAAPFRHPMLALHQQLRQGRSLAEAICSARTASGADPVAVATGWSFIAIGGA